MNRRQHLSTTNSSEYEVTRDLRDALRRELLALGFHAFGRCVGAVLSSMGYDHVHICRGGKGRNRDGGWDIEAQFPTGLVETRAICQIKHYESTPVQKRYVDELRGCMLRTEARQGVIVTLSTFSKTARTAAANGTIAPIRLIDGDELTRLMVAHTIGVSPKSNDQGEIDAKFFGRLRRADIYKPTRDKISRSGGSVSDGATSVTVVVKGTRQLRIAWKSRR